VALIPAPSTGRPAAHPTSRPALDAHGAAPAGGEPLEALDARDHEAEIEAHARAHRQRQILERGQPQAGLGLDAEDAGIARLRAGELLALGLAAKRPLGQVDAGRQPYRLVACAGGGEGDRADAAEAGDLVHGVLAGGMRREQHLEQGGDRIGPAPVALRHRRVLGRRLDLEALDAPFAVEVDARRALVAAGAGIDPIALGDHPALVERARGLDAQIDEPGDGTPALDVDAHEIAALVQVYGGLEGTHPKAADEGLVAGAIGGRGRSRRCRGDEREHRNQGAHWHLSAHPLRPLRRRRERRSAAPPSPAGARTARRRAA
jgi:hypothetical protein